MCEREKQGEQEEIRGHIVMMYVYMCVCVCVCVYVCVCVCVYICLFLYKQTHIHTHVSKGISVYRWFLQRAFFVALRRHVR